MHAKKEREHLFLSLTEIREIVMCKVEEYVAKRMPAGKKK
jgi:hypothetical protein